MSLNPALEAITTQELLDELDARLEVVAEEANGPDRRPHRAALARTRVGSIGRQCTEEMLTYRPLDA